MIVRGRRLLLPDRTSLVVEVTSESTHPFGTRLRLPEPFAVDLDTSGF